VGLPDADTVEEPERVTDALAELDLDVVTDGDTLPE
jgi:hypothetical protein